MVCDRGHVQLLGYPYTNYHGFGLAFAGGDVMYTGEKFAVRLDLRFGTGASLLTPIAPVKQAYAAWLPHEKLNIDVGFFDTIYGAEVVDEWNNANYTRGALYFLRQPFNHAGLRMGAELGDIVGMTVMVTNGGVYGGTPIDDNEVPALGWQFGFSPDGHNSVRRRGLREGYREVGLFFGGNHAPTGLNGNRDWANFFDFVLAMGFDWFHLLLNGDYYLDGNNTNAAGEKASDFQYGHSLALIFDVADQWSIGARGEHLSGNDLYREAGADFGGLCHGNADSSLQAGRVPGDQPRGPRRVGDAGTCTIRGAPRRPSWTRPRWRDHPAEQEAQLRGDSRRDGPHRELTER